MAMDIKRIEIGSARELAAYIDVLKEQKCEIWWAGNQYSIHWDNQNNRFSVTRDGTLDWRDRIHDFFAHRVFCLSTRSRAGQMTGYLNGRIKTDADAIERLVRNYRNDRSGDAEQRALRAISQFPAHRRGDALRRFLSAALLEPSPLLKAHLAGVGWHSPLVATVFGLIGELPAGAGAGLDDVFITYLQIAMLGRDEAATREDLGLCRQQLDKLDGERRREALEAAKRTFEGRGVSKTALTMLEFNYQPTATRAVGGG